MANPSLLQRLSGERRFVRRRILSAALLGAGVLALLPVLAVTLVDWFWALREATAFAVGLTLVLAGLIVVFVRVWRSLSTLPQQRDIALLVEESCPELMDSFICATELADNADEQSAIGQALIAQVESELTKRDIHGVIRQHTVPLGRLLAGAALLLGMFLVVANLPFGGKAVAHSRDLIKGESTGLHVEPGDVEVAAGDDLHVVCEIKRGPREARILIDSPRGQFAYDMIRKDDGDALGFDLYAVDESFSYVIETPTLRSPTFQVRIYQKPAITAVKLRVQPPAYTGMEPFELSEFKDFSVPSGSRVSFGITTNMPVSARVEGVGEAPLSLREIATHQYAGESVVRKSVAFAVVIEDAEQHEARTHRDYQIESIPDFPPILQIVSPEENAVRQPDGEIVYQVKALDEYGITEVALHYSISGEEWQKVPLYQSEAGAPLLPEQIVGYALPLEDLVMEGDVIAYYCSAKDNAEPKPNTGATDVFFVEIRPDPDEPVMDDSEGEGQGQQSMSVRDLIVEQKHLIRSAWTVQRLESSERRDEQLQSLAKSSGELHVETRKRYVDLKQALGNADLGLFDSLFNETIERMGTVIRFLEKGLVEEAMPYQQMALARLIQIEIELLKNSQKRQGKSSGTQSQEQQQAKSEDRKKEQLEKMEALERQLAKLEQLIERQEHINDALRKREENLEPGYRQYLSRKEEALQAETVALRNELRQERETYSVGAEVDKAVQNMDAMLARLQTEQTATPLKHGELAEQFLRRAQKLLRDIQHDMSGNELQQAERMLQAIREQQRKLREDTEAASSPSSPSSQQQTAQSSGQQSGQQPGQQSGEQSGQGKPGQQSGGQSAGAKPSTQPGQGGQPQTAGKPNEPGKAEGGGGKEGEPSESGQAGSKSLAKKPGKPTDLLGQQRDIREQFDEMMKQLGAATEKLDESRPDVADALGNAMRQAERANVGGKMKRSENALRYKRQKRAVKYQKQVEQALGELSEQLGNAMQQGGGPSNEQLTQMLETVLDDLAQSQQQNASGQGGQGGKGEALKQKIQQDVEHVAKQLKDSKMNQIAQQMGSALGQGPGSEAGKDVAALLLKTARLLEQKLMQNALKEKLELTRMAGRQPPDEYKKLVNQYFKNISSSF